MRPERLIVVVGTHTEVGKTWVCQKLIHLWKAKGLSVAARKPVQSFDAGSAPTDAELLAEASAEDVHTVCPSHRWDERASLHRRRLREPDDVILVADAGIGTINAIRLSLQVLTTCRVQILLNRYD